VLGNAVFSKEPMTNIYEQPWLLLIVACAAGLIVFTIGRLRPQRQKWWFWLLPVIIALAAFAFDYFIETDSEQVRDVIAGAVKAVEKGKTDVLEPLISEDYRDSFHASKQSLMYHSRAWLEERVIKENVYRVISLDVNSPEATAVFTVRVVLDPRGPIYEYVKMMFFKIRADFRKEVGKWRFIRVEILEPSDWQNIQTSLNEGMG
jgi:hypothetical protein